jgi:hypothetical protein
MLCCPPQLPARGAVPTRPSSPSETEMAPLRQQRVAGEQRYCVCQRPVHAAASVRLVAVGAAGARQRVR